MTAKIILGLAIAIAATLVAQPTSASAINTLVITETSSTSLTATLNGTTALSVTPTGVDAWTIALTGVGASSGFNTVAGWLEPEAGFVNGVAFLFGLPNQLFVHSDFPGAVGQADGTPNNTSFTFNGGVLSVTFNDLGDVAKVPDTCSTLGLLFLSVTALLGASRLCSLRLA